MVVNSSVLLQILFREPGAEAAVVSLGRVPSLIMDVADAAGNRDRLRLAARV